MPSSGTPAPGPFDLEEAILAALPWQVWATCPTAAVLVCDKADPDHVGTFALRVVEVLDVDGEPLDDADPSLESLGLPWLSDLTMVHDLGDGDLYDDAGYLYFYLFDDGALLAYEDDPWDDRPRRVAPDLTGQDVARRAAELVAVVERASAAERARRAAAEQETLEAIRECVHDAIPEATALTVEVAADDRVSVEICGLEVDGDTSDDWDPLLDDGWLRELLNDLAGLSPELRTEGSLTIDLRSGPPMSDDDRQPSSGGDPLARSGGGVLGDLVHELGDDELDDCVAHWSERAERHRANGDGLAAWWCGKVVAAARAERDRRHRDDPG